MKIREFYTDETFVIIMKNRQNVMKCHILPAVS